MCPTPDPLIVLPWYRGDKASDWDRLIVVCIIHPVMHELIMAVQRFNAARMSPEHLELAIKDPERHYYALSLMGTALGLEQIFVMYRRVMIGAIADHTAIVLAVALTALEEAVLRSTLVHRDTYFRRLLGYEDLSDDELMFQRKTWAVSA